MFVHNRRPHLSQPATLVAFGTALVAILAAVKANAHHPGSHAVRQPDGRVRLEVVATVTDACTTIASVRQGTPRNVTPPPAGTPVTAQLERPSSAACAAQVKVVRAEAVLDLEPSIRQLHLYVVAPDGSVAATERVPVR